MNNDLPLNVAKFLMNIPAETRRFLLDKISPYTLNRWFKQVENGLIKDKKELLSKIERIKRGEEELSDWAKAEYMLWRKE